MLQLPDRLFVRAAIAVALAIAAWVPAYGQELSVPCYAFQQDVLGTWIATAPLSINTEHGMIDIMPGHPVSVPVARILNARCP